MRRSLISRLEVDGIIGLRLSGETAQPNENLVKERLIAQRVRLFSTPCGAGYTLRRSLRSAQLYQWSVGHTRINEVKKKSPQLGRTKRNKRMELGTRRVSIQKTIARNCESHFWMPQLKILPQRQLRRSAQERWSRQMGLKSLTRRSD